MAEFLDGRLHPEARAEVMEHIANCPDCYSLVSAGWDYQETEQKELAPVVKGRFGRWWMGAVAAVAAAVIIVVALPVTQDAIEFRSGSADLIAAQNSAAKRPIEGRLSRFGYQEWRGVPRGNNGEVDEDTSKLLVQASAAKLLDIKARTARQWQAQSAAHLLLGERPEAIEAIEKAAAASPTDPSILNDRIVAYLAQYAWRGEPAAAKHALQAAERAWQVAQTPEIAFNRALAFKANERDKEEIAAWQEYLKLDPSSRWAEEANRNLQRLREPY